jgi:hypothetical protein
MIFHMPIDLHETIKKLANECTPPITQGKAATILLQIGVKSFIDKRALADSNEPIDMEAGE